MYGLYLQMCRISKSFYSYNVEFMLSLFIEHFWWLHLSLTVSYLSFYFGNLFLKVASLVYLILAVLIEHFGGLKDRARERVRVKKLLPGSDEKLWVGCGSNL